MAEARGLHGGVIDETMKTKPYKTCAWSVRRVDEDIYWDNYEMAIFQHRNEAVEYSEHLAERGIDAEVRQLDAYWVEIERVAHASE